MNEKVTREELIDYINDPFTPQSIKLYECITGRSILDCSKSIESYDSNTLEFFIDAVIYSIFSGIDPNLLINLIANVLEGAYKEDIQK